ncbi:MAG: hypothetical protein KDA78_12310 [Planctomycetaceae bacterium]|nr:hypothetical protein [Planctomycetaceae bacterium]
MDCSASAGSLRASHTTPVEHIPRHYRVPRQDEGLLIDPPLSQVQEQILQATENFQSRPASVWGESLQDLRTSARHELTQLLNLPDLNPNQPLILTGHQPEWIHPGVFLKSLVAVACTESTGGIAAHITIDSDTIKTRTITVPQCDQGVWTHQRIPIPLLKSGIPWQEARWASSNVIRKFNNALQTTEDCLQESPIASRLLESFPDINLTPVEMMIALRQSVEQSAGVDLPDVRLSALTQTPTWRWFLAGLITNGESLCQAYNAALARYRKGNDLHSNSHPMPDLQHDDSLTELPLWYWTVENPQRKAVCLRWENGKRLLTTRDGRQETVLPGNMSERAEIISALETLQANGGRLQTRALMTTLYLRLFLADWFIHGIGGAKYDEVTDDLMQTWLGLTPPPFQVATGTFWLPLKKGPEKREESLQDNRRKLRRARFHPNILFDESDRVRYASLLDRKQELILAQQQSRTTGLSRSQRRKRTPDNQERYRELETVRSELAKIVENRLAQLEQKCHELKNQQQQRAIAEYREYPILLYSQQMLQKIRNQVMQS